MSEPAPSQGVLAGVRVLDLTNMLSGPYCTMMLADHGAEVIKIEIPGKGDTSRPNGPFRADDTDHNWGGYFVSLNRSKKSIALNLKDENDKTAFLHLVKSAHVLVENYRPGVMERLGLGYEVLEKINPALVYASLSGFGNPRLGESPYVTWPSYDIVAQAVGGLIGITGPDDATPVKAAPGIGDIFTGLQLSFGILAALRHAEKTGEGQVVDVAMYDAILSLCERIVYQNSFENKVPGREGSGHPLLAPFNVFEASDGYVTIACVEDSFWHTFASIMGPEGIADDPRYATKAGRLEHKHELNRLANEWTRPYTMAELAERLGGKVPFGPVNTIADIMADPHTAARGMIMDVPNPDGPAWRVAANPVKFTRTPAPAAKSPPRIDQDAASLKPR